MSLSLRGKVTVVGEATADEATKFAASTSEIADLGRSWMGAVYKRMTMDVPQTQKNDYKAETVVVYTDDEGPDSAMFSAHYPSEMMAMVRTDGHSDWVKIVASVGSGTTHVLTLGGTDGAGNDGVVDDDSRAQIVGLSKTPRPRRDRSHHQGDVPRRLGHLRLF